MLLSADSKTNTSNGRNPAERRKYAQDPWGYLRDILGVARLSSDQDDFLDKIVHNSRVLAKASNAVGKCKYAQSHQTLSDGTRVPVAELVGKSFNLLTIDDGGQIVEASARAEWNRVEPIYRVTTESGRRIEANAEHPLYAARYVGRHGDPRKAPVEGIGWRGLGELSEGDAVAVPTALPAFGSERTRDDFVKVAAYLVAEGALTSHVQFHQNSGRVMDEFTACLDSLDQPWRLSTRTTRTPYAFFPWSGPLGQRLEGWGMRGLDSHTQRFPAFVWNLERDQFALFVNRLWAGDGTFWVTPPSPKQKDGAGKAEYTTVSERLAYDLQHALLRLGVSTKLRRRKTGYRRKDGTMWRGHAYCIAIHDAENLVRFDDAVGPVFGKEEAQAAAMALARGVLDRRAVQAAKHKANAYIPWREFGLPATLRWERIVSVEELPPEMTVAIEVPGYHTYLDDFYEHNTFLLSAVGVWFMDAVAAQLDDEGREQGALWIMTAPDASTVDSTIWAQALGHIERAGRNGYPMAGWYSDKSVLWRVRAEDWFIEKLSPPKRVGQEQQHGASGRHHTNLMVTIDEGPGVDPARYRAAEGMASGFSNKIIVAGNPTEIAGPYAEKAENGEYVVIRISALNHPNVVERKEVIPGGAVNHVTTDVRVKTWCFDRGEFDPERNLPDPKFFDFLYRLHPLVGTEEASQIPEPRPSDEVIEVDGIKYRVVGHADAPIHVFRPDSRFLPTVMGEFPLERSGGLFPGAFIDRAFEEWLKLAATNEMREIEKMPYDRVGVDPAEEGGDSPMIAPLWIRGGRKIFDRIRDVARGMDYEVAGHAYTRCGKRPEYIVDSIGVGSGVATRLDTDYGCTVVRFKASESAFNDEDAGEPEFYNKRAAAYWRASIELKEGRVIMPPDAELKEELRAHGYENRNGKILVTPKKKVRDLLGRSPDKADAWILGLFEEREKEEGGGIYAPMGGRAGSGPPTDYSMYQKAR